MIRVLICDDQRVVCEGLRVILGTASTLEVVGVARNGDDAIELVAEKHPDVVLMDLKLPGMNGVQATRVIRSRFPDVRVLVLTTFADDEWLFDAVRSGASGYLLKESDRDTIVEAIEGTAAGETYVDPVVAGRLLAHVSGGAPGPMSPIIQALTERELEVLRLIGSGASNADIADRLHLSEGTIRNYVSAVLAKLDVKDRTQAALLALRSGLVDRHSNG